MQKGNKTKKKILSRLWIACVTRAAWNSRKPRDYPKTESLNFHLSPPHVFFFSFLPFRRVLFFFIILLSWKILCGIFHFLFCLERTRKLGAHIKSLHVLNKNLFFLTSNDWDDPTTRDWNPYVLTCNTMSVDLLCTVERTYFFYLLPD